MDLPHKPTGTIEVTDSSTGRVCKVACLSCIRGHRATQCGIPVCRSKLFWTVKRPGRPSNTCYCRYGSTGQCQCGIVRSPCPHKQKGEKRTLDCRCDEHGRWCCTIEPEQWTALFAQQKPRVEFFPTREALEARHAPAPLPPVPATPGYSRSISQTLSSLPTTPSSSNGSHPSISPGLQFVQTPAPTTVPRFGMMGLGSPMGSNDHLGEDVLIWNGQAPPAPRDYQPYQNFNQPSEASFSTPPPPTLVPPMPAPYQYMPPMEQQHLYSPELAPPTQSFQQMTIPSYNTTAPAFDFDKLMADYNHYQFPSAICQNCGLSGCSCRSCPAVMQNFDGSWAQGCSRKHAFPQAPTATPAQPAPCCATTAAKLEQATAPLPPDVVSVDNFNTIQSMGAGPLQPRYDPTLSQELNVDAFRLPDGTVPTDLNDLLMKDLEQPAHGCCCGDRR